MREYSVYFPFFILHDWGKRSAEARSSHYAVLPLIKIFHISLVYWRNTALSSLAIHTVWLRSSALSCTNIPALLIKSFYQELVSDEIMREVGITDIDHSGFHKRNKKG